MPLKNWGLPECLHSLVHSSTGPDPGPVMKREDVDQWPTGIGNKKITLRLGLLGTKSQSSTRNYGP